MSEHVVAPAESLEEGESLIITIEAREIGVFNIDGQYYALPNWCAHQGGPSCEGTISGTAEETYDRQTLTKEREWVKYGRVLSCPWHGWEYDVTTGECLSRPGVALPSYSVRVENGNLVLDLG